MLVRRVRTSCWRRHRRGGGPVRCRAGPEGALAMAKSSTPPTRCRGIRAEVWGSVEPGHSSRSSCSSESGVGCPSVPDNPRSRRGPRVLGDNSWPVAEMLGAERYYADRRFRLVVGVRLCAGFIYGNQWDWFLPTPAKRSRLRHCGPCHRSSGARSKSAGDLLSLVPGILAAWLCAPGATWK